MRHGKKFNHLGRTSTHRKAMLSNMAASLIINKRITTTVAKAKALRQYVEPLITKSKTDSTQSRRVVFSYLQDKVSSQVLFSEVAEKVADRPGGYTRIIKLGGRLGDNAEMALIELVDFNDLYTQGEEQTKTRTRRSRRGGKSKSGGNDAQSAEASLAAVDTSADTEEAVAVASADEIASETILDAPPAADENNTDAATSTASAATEEDVPVAEEPVPEEPAVEVEVKEESDVIRLSGEAVLDEPIVVETTSDEESSDAPTSRNDEDDNEDNDEDKDKA
jgi:large subunit ribosomal protein L17